MTCELLVRYGAIPEIGRFSCSIEKVPERGTPVVLQTLRGMELGTVLEAVRRAGAPAADSAANHSADPDRDELHTQRVLHVASDEDLARSHSLKSEAQAAFSEWQNRMVDWKLQLDLIDLEWTLDRQKLLLYVLGARGAEPTRLALLAAAAGLAVVEVQPVGADGLVVPPQPAGGCGSGGCGCSH